MKREKRWGCLGRVGVESGVWSPGTFFVIRGASCVLCLQLASPKTTLRGGPCNNPCTLGQTGHTATLLSWLWTLRDTNKETGQQMVRVMVGKPSREGQDDSSAEKYGYKLAKDLKSEGKMELQAELDVINQATKNIQFYKSTLRNRLSQWYRNMIAAILE